MNEELLDLVLKYPELMDSLSPSCRKDLFIIYCRREQMEYVPSYVRVADAYNKAKMFKLTSVSKGIQEALGLKKDNTNMQIGYAKDKGLIERSLKTNHGKGYMQKNYKPKIS